MGATPSLKVTVPVAAAGLTVAVKVTVWPKVGEAGEGDSAMVEADLAVPA
jgi:hypothetical protein